MSESLLQLSSLLKNSLPYTAEDIQTNIRKYPVTTGEAVWQLFNLGKQSRLSTSDLGERCGVDGSVIAKLMNGSYVIKDYTEITAKIKSFLSLHTTEAVIVPSDSSFIASDYVHTSEAAKIHAYLNLARKYRRIGNIWADSQNGKTWACEAFIAELNKAAGKEKGIYLRMPAGGGKRVFCNRLAKKLNLPLTYSAPRVVEKIPEKMQELGIDFILFDEITQCLDDSLGQTQHKIDTMEYIREIFDTLKIGGCLVGTFIARDGMAKSSQKNILKQMVNRSLPPLELKKTPPKKDLDLIARKNFGLPPAPADIHEKIVRTIEQRGMTLYTMMLEMASGAAAADRENISWQHFLTAHDSLWTLALPTKEGK